MVEIKGEVSVEGVYQFFPGKKLSDYVTMAGGFQKIADRTQSYVIYPDGRSKKAGLFSNPKIKDGSIINIPKKPEESFSFTKYATELTSIWADMSQAYLMLLLAAVDNNGLKSNLKKRLHKMKFDDLYEIFKTEFSTDRLADISKELGVTPQVVSNWKSRNYVPYKYVKKMREIIKTLDEKPVQNIYIDNTVETERKDEGFEILISLIALYRNVVKMRNLSILSFSVVLLASIIYIKFIHEPMYTSTGKIMSASEKSSSQSLGGIASQFGLGSISGGKNILSSNVYPEIVKSYRFLNQLLDLKFTYKDGGKLKLINIVLDSDSLKSDWDDISRLNAVALLSDKISMFMNKKTGIITLLVTTDDRYFSKELASIVIKELDNTLKRYEKKQLKEKLDYITIRINEVTKELNEAEENLKDFREKNRKINASPHLILEEDRLSREVEVQVEIFTTLKTELELTQVELIKRANFLITLDSPRMPLYPTNFSTSRILFLSMVIGVFVSVSIVFCVDWYKQIKRL